MTTPILFASSLLAIVLTAALVHQIKLRLALQRLLSRLLTVWRNQHAENRPFTSTDVDDPAAVPGDRL